MKGFVLKLTVLSIVSMAIVGSLITGRAQERGNEIEVTGYFNVHTTNPDRSTTFSVYEPETGNRYELHGATEFIRDQGGYLGLIGRNVFVAGDLSDDGNAIDVTDFRLAEFTTARHIDLIDSRHWIGPQHYVNVLCRFGDATDVTPQPPSYFEDDLLPELNAFWGEISYGKAEMQFTTEGWFNLDTPREDYLRDDGVLRFEQLRDDCLTVAEDDVDFRGYDGINMMFNQDLDGNSYGDVVSLDLNGEVNTYGLTWMAHEHWQLDPNDQRPLHVTLHEFGHSLGLSHSCEVPTAVYGSRWDFMSSGVVTNTIAVNKDKFGWIDDGAKYVPSEDENQLIFLEHLSEPNPTLVDNEYLMANIPIPGSDTRFYTVEMRMRDGSYDDGIPADRGVLLHEVDLLREHPDHGAGYFDCQASLVDARGLGSSFSDAGAGMRPGLNSMYEFPDEEVLNLSIAPLYETDTGTWVVFNPDLELTVDAPDEVVAGEEFEVVVSLTANDEPASFADGWQTFVGFPLFDNITFDENGQATFTVTREFASQRTIAVDFAYLQDQATVDVLPGPPASLDLSAVPGTQTVGESVDLNVRNVEDEFGNTVAEGTEIDFGIDASTGEEPVRTDGGSGWTASTDANGTASLSYTRLFPSNDVVTASAGDDPVATSDPVDVNWTLPESDADIELRAQTQQLRDAKLNLAVNSMSDKLTGTVVFADDSHRFTATELLSATVTDDSAVIYAEADIAGAGEEIVRVDLYNVGQSDPTARVRWIDHDTGEFGLGRASIR